MELNGKIALVTGGTGALGETVCRRLLEEGCTVYATKRRTSPKGTPAGTRSVIADVTEEADVVSCFATVMRETGKLDIVVNTVGGFLPRTPIKDLSVADWDTMMRLNLRSTFLCTREAIRCMVDRAYGRIVNVSAMVGVHPTAGRSAYGISKAGVILLTEVAAEEVKGSGITVNAIAPYIIDTPANRSAMPEEDFTKWTPPEAIASAIIFLCSDAASAVNGSVLKM